MIAPKRFDNFFIFIIFYLLAGHIWAQEGIPVSNDQVTQIDFKGKAIHCLEQNSKLVPGSVKVRAGQSYFVALSDRISVKRKKLKKKRRRIGRKKYRKKLAKFNKNLKAQKLACQTDTGKNPNNPKLPEVPLDVQEAYSRHTEKLSVSDIQHLYRRAAFGATAGDLSHGKQHALPAIIERLFKDQDETEVRTAAEALAYYTDEEGQQLGLYGLKNTFLYYMLNGPNVLKEKLAYFWHDRLAAAGRVADGSDHFTHQYMHLLRTHALGNLRDLLKAMTVNGLMLKWLDGDVNVAGGVNENYAREFWELFTLGHGHYSEKDIAESARAFTGWTTEWDENTEEEYVFFDSDSFDAGQKNIFENSNYQTNGNFTAMDMVDLTLARGPQAATFLARGLLDFFVAKNLADSYVHHLANLIIENSYNIKPVLRTLLQSKLFFSGAARKNGIKTPLEFSIGFVRSLGLQVPASWYMQHYTIRQGLEVLNPPTVKGWDDDQYWLNDQWMLNRVNFIHNTLDVINWDGQEFNYRSLLPRANAGAKEFLDFALERLDLTLTNDQRASLLSYLKNLRNDNGQNQSVDLRTADDWTVYLKTSGLYYILAQHPDYQLR